MTGAAHVVSVVVVTYQHAKFIRETLVSALTQNTTFPFEVLVGEDDSADGTRAICRELAAEYPDRMRLFERRREDSIRIAGRGTGRTNFIATMREARGEFVALLEGDDRWTHPEKLARQVAYLRAHPEASACYHRMQMRRASDDALVGLLPAVDPRAPRRTRDLVRRNGIGTASIVYRRSALPAEWPEAFWHHAPMGDLPMHILASLRGDLHYLPLTMGVYRVGSGHWSTRSHLETIDASIRMRELLPLLIGDRLDAELKPWLARRRLERVVACLALGDDAAARDSIAAVDATLLRRRDRVRLRAARLALRRPDAAKQALGGWSAARAQVRALWARVRR